MSKQEPVASFNLSNLVALSLNVASVAQSVSTARQLEFAPMPFASPEREGHNVEEGGPTSAFRLV